jgi:hypothetical protein
MQGGDVASEHDPAWPSQQPPDEAELLSYGVFQALLPAIPQLVQVLQSIQHRLPVRIAGELFVQQALRLAHRRN